MGISTFKIRGRGWPLKQPEIKKLGVKMQTLRVITSGINDPQKPLVIQNWGSFLQNMPLWPMSPSSTTPGWSSRYNLLQLFHAYHWNCMGHGIVWRGKSRGLPFYYLLPHLPSINVGDWAMAFGNMTQINIALRGVGSLFLLNWTKCTNIFSMNVGGILVPLTHLKPLWTH